MFFNFKTKENVTEKDTMLLNNLNKLDLKKTIKQKMEPVKN